MVTPNAPVSKLAPYAPLGHQVIDTLSQHRLDQRHGRERDPGNDRHRLPYCEDR